MVRAMAPGKLPEATHLFEPKAAYRYAGGGGGFERAQPGTGKNPPSGAVVYYYLKGKPTSDVVLKFTDSSGKLVGEITSKPEPKERPAWKRMRDLARRSLQRSPGSIDSFGIFATQMLPVSPE